MYLNVYIYTNTSYYITTIVRVFYSPDTHVYGARTIFIKRTGLARKRIIYKHTKSFEQ